MPNAASHAHDPVQEEHVFHPQAPSRNSPRTGAARGVTAPFILEDLRRSRRIRKASLVSLVLDGVDTPSIAAARDLDDYKRAFRLVHDEYARSGYIAPNPEHPYQYSTFSFLPKTRVFVFKSSRQVVATLTEILDTPEHGLPMDSLYHKELDDLRGKGRTVAELSSFVTSRTFRMRNIMVYLSKAMFNHSRQAKVDDICVMVNPKHAAFYKTMFLFEPFGQVRFYEKVHAPAVPLRVNMRRIAERLHEKYANPACGEDLHEFFCTANTTLDALMDGSIPHEEQHAPPDVIDFFRHPRTGPLPPDGPRARPRRSFAQRVPPVNSGGTSHPQLRDTRIVMARAGGMYGP